MTEPTARPSRFAGGVQLENVLKKRPALATAPASELPEANAKPASREATPNKTTPQRHEPARPVSKTTGGSRRVPFNLPTDLHEALVARKTADGKSKTVVVLEAIEAAHHAGALTTLAAQPKAKPTGLFVLPENRPSAEGVVPAEIRLAEANCVVIDNLVEAHNLGTRTELIVRSLRFHLGLTESDQSAT